MALREHFDVNNIISSKTNLDDIYYHIYFALLYFAYAITNIILPVLTGGMRDSLGDRMILLMLGLLIILGQVIFTIGV